VRLTARAVEDPGGDAIAGGVDALGTVFVFAYAAGGRCAHFLPRAFEHLGDGAAGFLAGVAGAGGDGVAELPAEVVDGAAVVVVVEGIGPAAAVVAGEVEVGEGV
jgi:hypothetical protein